MNYALAGQTLGSIGFVLVIGYAVYEIVQTIRDQRRRAKVESHEALLEKIDRFTNQYGQRSEVPDDEPWVA